MWSATGLVLGPGGIKGFLELGFLLYMEKNGLLDKVDAFAGVSIGAIISLLLTAGYTVYEVINEAAKTNIMEDVSSIRLHDIQQNIGLISQRGIQENLDRLIKAKFGKILTMKELYMATGIELYMTSFELDKDPHPVYFSAKATPNISCTEAAILSANLPLIFHRLYYNGKCYIDGALGDPDPVHLLDNGKRDVLSIYIESTFDNKDGFVTYLRQIFYAGMVQLRNVSIKHASPRCKHIGLKSNSLDTVGIVTSSEDKINMVTEGFEAAQKFYEQNTGSLLVAPDSIEIIEDFCP